MTRKRKSAALVLLVDVSENSPSKSPNAMDCPIDERRVSAGERLPEFSNRCAEIFDGAGTRLDGCREYLNDKRRPAEWKRSDLSHHKRRRNGGKSKSETALCGVGIPVASNAGNRAATLSLSPRAKSGSNPSLRPRSRANRYSRHPRRKRGKKRRSAVRLTHYSLPSARLCLFDKKVSPTQSKNKSGWQRQKTGSQKPKQSFQPSGKVLEQVLKKLFQRGKTFVSV